VLLDQEADITFLHFTPEEHAYGTVIL